MKDAFSALQKDAKAARMYQGLTSDQLGQHGRFQTAFLSGIQDALNEVPMISLDVTPDAVFMGDVMVLEGSERRGDMLDVLFAEGLRAVALEVGVSDDELLTMARILLTPWHQHGHGDADLASTVWEADFAHVYFEVVDGLGDREDDEQGDSPVVRELLGMVKELNAAAGNNDELARVRQDELAVLLRLRDHVQFDDDDPAAEALDAPMPKLATVLSAGLAAEVAALRDDTDLRSADIPGMLAACLPRCDDDARARVVGEALFTYLANVVVAVGASSTLVQRAQALLDPDLTPELPHREVVRDAATVLAQDPLRNRLGRLLEGSDRSELSGTLFSLVSLLPGEDDAVALAEALPLWAVRVLADAVLLRAAAKPREAIDVSKRFAHDARLGSILIGLCMMSRQEDPRLVEAALAHAGHDSDLVRESVLVAIRAQQTPRVRETVRRALSDAAEPVRLEALRYCVAYRDTEVAVQLETRLLDPRLGGTSPTELRALCISYGRLAPGRAETLLLEFAQGRRESGHPELPRLALHGLRAVGSATARSALERLTHTHPSLAAEAQDLLTRWGPA